VSARRLGRLHRLASAEVTGVLAARWSALSDDESAPP
jgi:hypothetical protein